MTEVDSLVVFFALVGMVFAARLLDTGPGRRFLRARISRLTDWWAARQSRSSDGDQEYDELSAVLRRQELRAHADRLRRIVATDESMSATRQIANRLAYRWILRELEKTPEIPWITDDDPRWSPSVMAIRPSTYDSARRPAAEVLEIGWRR